MKIHGKNLRILNNSGFSLIELVIVLIAVSILAGMAIQSMSALMTDRRQAKTEQELEDLSEAIVGNPKITAGGGRIDFGYVGDVGAFPSNLDDLRNNPGGFSTWDGPYIKPGFSNDDGFKNDEWGTPYNYSGGISITSVGSGSTITKKIADASSDYLLNSFNGTIKDASDSLPGVDFIDSVDIKISIPNGIGGTLTKSYQCNSSGFFTLDSLPVGQHPLRIIYTPNVDTLFSYLTIFPRHKSSGNYKFASSYFSTGGPSGSPEILRPNGVGSLTELDSENCSNGWQCVDEAISDGDGTFVKGNSNQWKYDSYTVEDHSAGSGTINYIIIYVNAKGSGAGKQARSYNKTNGSGHNGFIHNTTSSYVPYSTLYVTNPTTGLPWTWDDIDNLEIGAGIKKDAFVTQVWVEVFYTE